MIVAYVGLILALTMQISRNGDLQHLVDKAAAHPRIEIEKPSLFAEFPRGAFQTFSVSGRFHSIEPVDDLTIVISIWDERFRKLASETTVLRKLELKNQFGASLSLIEPLPLGVYHVRAVAFVEGNEVASTTNPIAIRTRKDLKDGGIF